MKPLLFKNEYRGIKIVQGKPSYIKIWKKVCKYILLFLVLLTVGFTNYVKPDRSVTLHSTTAELFILFDRAGINLGALDRTLTSFKKALALSSSDSVPAVETIRWVPANSSPFIVNGLWWFNENSGTYNRLPNRIEMLGHLNRQMLKYSEYPAGARVRFKTDSQSLSLRVHHGGDTFAWKELSIMAMAGIELYEGDPGQMIFRGISSPKSGSTPYVIDFSLASTKELQEYTLYLPMYAKLKMLDIALEPNSRIEPPTPFVLSKPIVFYGSSFIQGGCASRSSMNLPALIGRKLGVDIINLGFAGDGNYELEMANLMTEIDAACFIMGPILNNPELMEMNYPRFISRLRQQRPDCPIFLMTRLHSIGHSEPYGVNDLVREVFEEMKASGDQYVYYFDSFVLYSDGSVHPTVEGLHPSDLGFNMIADALAPKLKEVLGLPSD